MDRVAAAWPVLGVQAFTTRIVGGVSTGAYSSLNLATHVGDVPTRVAENRARLIRAGNLPSAPVWLEQVHGVVLFRAETALIAAPPPVADGCFTSERQVVCAVLTADCLPIVLADGQGRAVAVLHGGWRGLAQGIIARAVTRLGLPPQDLYAWLGPAIGPAAYEVGSEVRDAFRDVACAFHFLAPGRFLADLYAIARYQLRQAGVERVYGGGHCTYTDRGWFSYRRQSCCGRMATVAWLV